jgi:hypothetical protein
MGRLTIGCGDKGAVADTNTGDVGNGIEFAGGTGTYRDTKLTSTHGNSFENEAARKNDTASFMTGAARTQSSWATAHNQSS